MNQKIRLSVIVTCALFSLTACGQGASENEAATPPSQPGSTPNMPNMPGMQNSPQSVEHRAEGTINSINQAAGTVNISHGPVASASWPAMTMSFKLADPELAAQLSAGQRVQFRFTIESGMNATVTGIAPVE